jgi:hypothetical protein
MEMKPKSLPTGVYLLALLALSASSAFGSSRFVGVSPHDGLSMFVKSFMVPAGRNLQD